MPNSYLNKLSKDKKIPLSDLEKKWDKAKSLAKEEGHEEEWDYITAIFKKLANINESLNEEWYDNLRYSSGYLRGRANVHGVNDPEEMPLLLKNKTIDFKLMWNIMKYLTAPIETLPPFKNGLIDEKGRPTGKKPQGKEGRTYTNTIKLILGLRRSLSKMIPDTRLQLAIQKLFLLREYEEFTIINKDYVTILEMTTSGGIATGGESANDITDDKLFDLIKKLKNKNVIKNIKDYFDNNYK